jgi:hypothetical protein
VRGRSFKILAGLLVGATPLRFSTDLITFSTFLPPIKPVDGVLWGAGRPF